MVKTMNLLRFGGKAYFGICGVALFALGVIQHSEVVKVSFIIIGFIFLIASALIHIWDRVGRLESIKNHKRAHEFPGIYRITCKSNGKQYIGQTSQAIQARWDEHIHSLQVGRHHNRWLQADWNIYKPDMFSFEVLEVVTDPIWLLDRERYWQDKDYNASKRYNPPNIPPRIQRSKMAKRKPRN